MRALYEAFLNLLYPPTCLACQAPLAYSEKHLCVTCLASLPSAELEIPSKKRVLMQKMYGEVPLKHAFSLYYFSKEGRVQQLLHNLKYQHQTEALLYLGRHFGSLLQIQGYHQHFDLITPVPLHTTKLQTRGYNQSALFAKGISQTLQIPFTQNLLLRKSATHTQTAKSRQQRWKNVAHAFSLQKNTASTITKKRILLIDDLVTTGATIAACAQPLLQASPKNISIATLAIALQE